MDNPHLLKKVMDDTRQKNQRKYQENSKSRLLKNVAKKFNTTMIGALVSFEEEFGYLWGFGQDQLTVEQMKMREKWEIARSEILNKGNNQLRACQDEIAQYTMTWDRYKTEFVMRTKQ